MSYVDQNEASVPVRILGDSLGAGTRAITVNG